LIALNSKSPLACTQDLRGRTTSQRSLQVCRSALFLPERAGPFHRRQARVHSHGHPCQSGSVIMATTSSMFMYSLTIQPPSAITQAILGQFAGTKEQQIVTASGSTLTINRPDASLGKVSPIFSQDCFGIIRTLAAFRLSGSIKGMLESISFQHNRGCVYQGVRQLGSMCK
jgi:hypothetical protein